MKRRTKIVCTLGPATDTREGIAQLVAAGMNVARINCSHGSWEHRRQWIQWIRELSDEIGPIGILADLQGPKFRIGDVPGGSIELSVGDAITVGAHPDATIIVPTGGIFDALVTGCRVLLGDGNVELKLGGRKGDIFEAKATSGGEVRSRQGITLVGRSFDVPALTDKDLIDLEEACAAGVDFIALSYVRRAADIRELKRLVDKFDSSIRLCAKIETREAIKDIDEIVKISDIVMVARGDLGLQMDLEDVPIAQKKVIERCGQYGKPVITATQMLESMVTNARPTRAEATDVANAILDGTDAVMLSGETAVGKYPVEAVKTMARIAEVAEAAFDYGARLSSRPLAAQGLYEDTEAVAQAAVHLATGLKAKAIITTTTSGLTARMVSKFRPRMPILCAAWDERVWRQMSMLWGVDAVYVPIVEQTDEAIHAAIHQFMKVRRLKVDDRVVVTAGVPPGKAGHTNLIFVESVT